MIVTLPLNGLIKTLGNARMQRGGFDIIPIKDSDFKYTIDPDRKLWTKNVFPIAEYIIQAIQNIPWSTYKFEGTTAFWRMEDGNYVREDKEISIVPGSLQYYYFGGCVYEIMNKLYDRPTMPKLRSFVDPTGDLDVMIVPPKIQFADTNSSKNYFAYFFNELPPNMKDIPNLKRVWNSGQLAFNLAAKNANVEGNEDNAEPVESVGCQLNVFTGNNVTESKPKRDSRRYSAFIEQYTNWIMDQFAANLKQYARGSLFDLLFGNTVKFNIENDGEGKYADRILCLGNIKIVRSFLPYMGLIKLQLIAKFKGMSHSDHICEFLITMPTTPQSHFTLEKYEDMKHKYHVLKGYPLTNFGELVRGNIDSLINRYSLYNTEIRHKFYNHVGRMEYLHQFLKKNVTPYYMKSTTLIKLDDKDYKELGNQLAIFCFYIIENYFSNTLLNFDPKIKRTNLSKTQAYVTEIRILQRLIGSYSSFLIHQKADGELSSPFRTVSFEYEEPIPARTPFFIKNIFKNVDLLPISYLREIGINEYPVEQIDIVQTFLVLVEMGILRI